MSAMSFVGRLLVALRAFIGLYIALQVITGIEVGLSAVAVTILGEVSLPVALAVTIPLGFPMFLLQGSFALAWRTGLTSLSAPQPEA